MATLNLLYKDQYPINDSIKIVIPTVGDIVDNEDAYYNIISALTAMPIDMMVQLDDAGIDFTEINDYELFLMLFPGLQASDTSLVFGDLDLSKFELSIRESNNTVVLYNRENGVVIDRAIYTRIAGALREIHRLEKDRRKPANKEAKEYMLERARTKMRSNRSRTRKSELEPLIIAMVNTEQYKYDYEGTRRLSIYQFNESVRQVIQKVDYDNRMYGVYTGTIDVKAMSQDDFNWLTHK